MISLETVASHRVSVVVPCFNEEGNIESLVKEAKAVVSRNPAIDFIFVDNGSSDGSRHLLRTLVTNQNQLSIALVEKNQGYGHGIKTGLLLAEGDFVGWTHADRQTKLTDLELAHKLLGTLTGPTILKGKRTGRPIADRLFTGGMSFFETIVFGTKFQDINAQPTIFSRALLDEVGHGPNDFSLDLFTYFVAKRMRYEELRFHVTFGPRFSGVSKWNTSAKARLKFIWRTITYSLALKRSIGKL